MSIKTKQGRELKVNNVIREGVKSPFPLTFFSLFHLPVSPYPFFLFNSNYSNSSSYRWTRTEKFNNGIRLRRIRQKWRYEGGEGLIRL